MSSQNAARKAWNDAMKATASAAALPPSLQAANRKRRSDRNKQSKQDRRAKARKVFFTASQNIEGVDEAEQSAYRASIWMDALEDIDPAIQATDDDEEYDELGELENSRERSSSRKRRKTISTDLKTLPKRFLPRTAASVLLEEATNYRDEGVAKAYLASHEKLSLHQQRPPRKFCPVTGLMGIYTEPKTGIPYATIKALEQIRERQPPWMTLGGSAAYWEAAKRIEEE